MSAPQNWSQSILFTPWWLAPVQNINPSPISSSDLTKLKTQSTPKEDLSPGRCMFKCSLFWSVWFQLVIWCYRNRVECHDSSLLCFLLAIVHWTLAPNFATTRWQHSYPRYLASFLYCGRKWWHIVQLYLCQWFLFIPLLFLSKVTANMPVWNCSWHECPLDHGWLRMR